MGLEVPNKFSRKQFLCSRKEEGCGEVREVGEESQGAGPRGREGGGGSPRRPEAEKPGELRSV